MTLVLLRSSVPWTSLGFSHLFTTSHLWLRDCLTPDWHHSHQCEGHTSSLQAEDEVFSRDSAFPLTDPVICVVTLVWQLQLFPGLLWGGRHSISDRGSFNGGKITGRVWIKTAFKQLTFLFPWLLLVGSESSSAGRRWGWLRSFCLCFPDA